MQVRIAQHQELHVQVSKSEYVCVECSVVLQVGEQLRSFLLSFPSVENNAVKLIQPFGGAVSRVGKIVLWSEDEFNSLKEGLMVPLHSLLRVLINYYTVTGRSAMRPRNVWRCGE